MAEGQRRVTDFASQKKELQDRLRETYDSYVDFEKKGRLRMHKMKMKNGRNHYDFDFEKQQPYYYNAKPHVFLDEPDVQNEFISQILASLQPKTKPHFKTSQYADQMTKRIQQHMIQKSDLMSIKAKIKSHFKRKLAALEIKRKNTVSRYSYQLYQTTLQTVKPDSVQLNKSEAFLLSRIRLIDVEMAQLESRIERLSMEEGFSAAASGGVSRPVAVNWKGERMYRVMDDGELCFTNLTREDFEVYLRAMQYNRKITADVWKFFYAAKWTHYSHRSELLQSVSDRMNKMRVSHERTWLDYCSTIISAIQTRIAEKYPASQNEMRIIFDKFFEKIKGRCKDDKQFNDLSQRFDIMKLWPSTKVEQNGLLQLANDLFFKDPINSAQEQQSIVFKINLAMGIIFENQLKITKYETKEDGLFKHEQGQGDTDASKASSTGGDNQGIVREKLSHLDEALLRKQINGLITAPRRILVVDTDWIDLLQFQPTLDSEQSHVMNHLNLASISTDISTKLIVSFLNERDFTKMKSYINEQTKSIMESYQEKFFLFIENLKYIDKSHNSISFDLLVDTYQEGMRDKQVAFETNKSKRLESREEVKKEHLSHIVDMFQEMKPSETALEASYGFIFLKSMEFRRKIINILNAIRSIERRISFDLIKLFNCHRIEDQDDECFTKGDDPLKYSKGQQSAGAKNNQSSSAKPERGMPASFSEVKREFEEKYQKAIPSSFVLGRIDIIEYQNNSSMDDSGFEQIPEIYVKGDERDERSGMCRSILYDISERDMQRIEERLIRTISLLIDKFEKVNRVKDFFSIIDRMVTVFEIMKVEMRYQFAKLRLLEQQMQVYENITDPVQAYQLAEMILNTIAEIPALDFKAFSFADSYEVNIQRMQTITKFIRSMFVTQVKKEVEENERFHRRFTEIIASNNEKDIQLSEDLMTGGSCLSKEANKQQEASFAERLAKKSDFVEKIKKMQKGSAVETDDNERLQRKSSMYDQFCLEKNMEDVFEKIVTKKAEDNPDKQTKTEAPLSGINATDSSGNNGATRIGIHRKFEGGPHKLFLKSKYIPAVRISPSQEEMNFLNFFESAHIITMILGIVPQILEDFKTSFPQKSMLASQLLQIALFEKLSSNWGTFNSRIVKGLEDSMFCDDVNSLEAVVQHAVSTVVESIDKNNEEVLVASSDAPKPVEEWPDKEFLLGLDYMSLSNFINSKKVMKSINYRELFLNCNLVELLDIRENLLHSIWERRVLTRIYKQQHLYFDIVAKKYTDIYSSSPITQMLDMHGMSFNPKIPQFLKKKNSPILYFNEIDTSLERQVKLKDASSIAQLLLNDNLAEFKNIHIYEKINLCGLENSVKLTQARVDTVQGAEFDLNLINKSKCIPENPTINTELIYLTPSNILTLIHQIKALKNDICTRKKEQYFFTFLDAKNRVRTTAKEKIQEFIRNISKERNHLPPAHKIILKEKHFKLLKLHVISVANTDLIGELNREWGRIECLHLCRTLRRFFQCIPSIDSYLRIQKNDDRLLYETLYAGQKKSKKEDSKGQASEANKQKLIDDMRVFIGKNLSINDDFTIHSDYAILKKQFIENLLFDNTSSATTSIDSNASLDDLLLVSPIGAIQREEIIAQYTKQGKLKEKLLFYFLKLNSTMTGNKSPKYGKYTYATLESSGGIVCLNKLYKSMIQFTQVHFLSLQMSLSDAELRLLQEMLLFNVDFNQVSPQADMEQQIFSGKDVNASLLSFDQKQQQLTRENLEPAHVNSEQPSKLKIVSQIIDGLVRKFQSFSNLEESFRDFIRDMTFINASINPKNRGGKNSLSALIGMGTSGNEQSTSELVSINQAKQIIKDYCNLLYCKIKVKISDRFMGQCSTEAVTPLVSNYFSINQDLFLPNVANVLQLKYLNTQYFNRSEKCNTFHKKSSGKDFKRFSRRIFTKVKDVPSFKLRLLFAYLPLDLEKFIFNFQGKNAVKNEDTILSNVATPLAKLSSSFSRKVLIRNSDLPTNTLMKLKDEERIGIAGMVRNFEREIKHFKTYKNEKPNEVKQELAYLEVVLHSRMLTQAIQIYSKNFTYPMDPIKFARDFNTQRIQFNERIQEVKNNIEEYSKRKLIILNSSLLESFSAQLLAENQDFNRTYMHLLQICLEKTFMIEELSKMMYFCAFDTLENEYSNLQIKNQVRQALYSQGVGSNAGSLIKVNPCYSSPLFVDEKSSMIPAITRSSFVHCFINRLRNKVSRVDLLSSGFGFVISVNDLEDCVAYLNKGLQLSKEKEIHRRTESARLVYQLQASKIKSQQIIINSLEEKLVQITAYQSKHIDALVHKQGNNLIFEMGKIQKKQADFKKYLSNLEKDVTREVRKQMNTELISLENDKLLLKNRFTDYRRQLTVRLSHQVNVARKKIKKDLQLMGQTAEELLALAEVPEKEEDKGDDNNIGNFAEKVEQLKEIEEYNKSRGFDRQISKPKVSKSEAEKEEEYKYKSEEQIQREEERRKRDDEEEQECLYNNPATAIRYINKIRIFYLIKMAGMKDKYEKIIQTQEEDVASNKGLHAELIANKKEENAVKKELVLTHNSLKDEELKNRQLSIELEVLTLEKHNMEKTIDLLNKRISSFEKQSEDLKQHDSVTEKLQQQIKEKEDYIQQLLYSQSQLNETINMVNQNSQNQVRIVREKVKQEQYLKNLALSKVNSPQLNHTPFPISSSFSDSAWLARCQDLYIMNQSLQEENDSWREIFTQFSTEMMSSTSDCHSNQVLMHLHDKAKELLVIPRNEENIALHQRVSAPPDLDNQLRGIFNTIESIKQEKLVKLETLVESASRKSRKVGDGFNPYSQDSLQSPQSLMYSSKHGLSTSANRNRVVTEQHEEPWRSTSRNNSSSDALQPDLSYLFKHKTSSSSNRASSSTNQKMPPLIKSPMKQLITQSAQKHSSPNPLSGQVQFKKRPTVTNFTMS